MSHRSWTDVRNSPTAPRDDQTRACPFRKGVARIWLHRRHERQFVGTGSMDGHKLRGRGSASSELAMYLLIYKMKRRC
jgi:hypothetical protein